MSSPHVIDVTAAEFVEGVIRESKNRLVLVDFWASWCGPCRVLGPVLEALAQEYGGRFLLAKVDTEANPELSQQFGIQGIPAVKFFHGGKIVDEFVGALPAPVIREKLKTWFPSEADQKFAIAADLIANGDSAGAAAILGELHTADPKHAPTNLALAKIAFANVDPNTLRHHAEMIYPDADIYDEAQGWLGAARFLEATDSSASEAAAQFAAASDHARAQHWESSLDALLRVVELDRKFEDDLGRRAMLWIFAIVGPQHEVTRHYRRKLSMLI